MNFVQASITSISFPQSLEGAWDMVDKHGAWLTDLDVLLASEADGREALYWTAPRWMTQGDILLFYHTKSARRNIARLRQEMDERLARTGVRGRLSGEPKRTRRMRALLERAAELSGRYSGTIFGCAQVSGSTEYLEKEFEEEPHFKGRFFAPLRPVRIFERPLPQDEFSRYVRIGQNVNTPLYGASFVGIRGLLARRNVLPGFVANARSLGKTFREIDRHNWPEISCRPEVRFIDEEQVRAFLLDFLLDEIKDKRTPLLKECWCYRNGERTGGRADYFASVHGAWIPVEAKLNVRAERDILGQVAKYTRVDSFVPTLGNHRSDAYVSDAASVCLVADQSGVYIVSDGEFRDCSPGNPLWRREDLTHSTAQTIRRRIVEEMS